MRIILFIIIIIFFNLFFFIVTSAYTEKVEKRTHRLVSARMCGCSEVAMVTINKENVRRTARSSTETQPAPPSVHLQTSAGKKQAYL